jgi:serine/threonine-protein kinase
MPTRSDVNFLLTAVKAKFISADQAKQIYEMHQEEEKHGGSPLIHQTAMKLGLLDMAQVARLQRMLLAVTDEAKDQPEKKKVTQIGDFKLLSKLGEGAMGMVYKAVQLSTNRDVAIKILRRKFQEDPKYLERFKREYTNASRLQHPNIIEFVDAGQTPPEQGGYYYFAMEFVDGETYQERLDRQGVIPEGDAIRVGVEIGKALAHAHAHNIKHRDIKPDNIMLSRTGAIKLTDLGLAKEEQDSSVTQAGMTIGTPHYMSPEQARGMELDERSDIYSLGATLYHLVTGRPPFEGKSAAIVMLKHIEEQLPSPKELNRELSDDVCVVIAKMMAKSPDDRYPTATAVVEELERIMAGVPPQHAKVPSGKSSIRMPAVQVSPPSPGDGVVLKSVAQKREVVGPAMGEDPPVPGEGVRRGHSRRIAPPKSTVSPFLVALGAGVIVFVVFLLFLIWWMWSGYRK